MMIMKQMLEALQLKRKNTGTKQLKTIWGEQIDKEHVLEEYPRPQMVRDNYTILNGIYQYAFTGSSEMPSCYDGEILVPFSPETEMSGVGRQLQPNEYLWYERSFILEQLPKGKRLLLHFGACDERCRVYINGEQVGTHAGGYQAFYFDMTYGQYPLANTYNFTPEKYGVNRKNIHNVLGVEGELCFEILKNV